MRRNRYYIISGLVFFIVSILHFIRALYGVEIIINGWFVPIWISWIAFLGAGFLSLIAFTLNKKHNAR